MIWPAAAFRLVFCHGSTVSNEIQHGNLGVIRFGPRSMVIPR
jgi:hypothetical protein